MFLLSLSDVSATTNITFQCLTISNYRAENQSLTSVAEGHSIEQKDMAIPFDFEVAALFELAQDTIDGAPRSPGEAG